jgi:tetratricopeptide (TPR) repeat protein
VKKIINLIVSCFLLLTNIIGQESPTELFNKAMEFKKTRNCNEVLELLNKAIALKQDFGEAWLEKGWCLNELNRSQEAVPALQKANTLLKNNYNVYSELAHAWYNLDKKDSAIKYFKETLRLKPDYQPAVIGMADLFREKLNDNEQALNWYLKSAKVDSSHKKTNYWIGWCYNDKKKYDSAAYYLQKVLNVDASNIPASVELGYAYYSLGRYSDAIEAFKPALAAKTKSEPAIFYSGMCLAKTGSKASALDKYNELVILNSSFASQLLAEIQKMK